MISSTFPQLLFKVFTVHIFSHVNQKIYTLPRYTNHKITLWARFDISQFREFVFSPKAQYVRSS